MIIETENVFTIQNSGKKEGKVLNYIVELREPSLEESSSEESSSNHETKANAFRACF